MSSATEIAFDRAATACGGLSKLASRIGVSIQTAMNWRTRGVPEDRCLPIEQATREAKSTVFCEDLRPDLKWVRIADDSGKHPDGFPLLNVSKPLAEAPKAVAA